jgi:Family of unknown function (DUF6049)
VHSLLRVAALAATVAATASAALAGLPAAASQASQASQAAAQLSIEINSVSPQFATQGSTITVRGEVANDTSEPVNGLSVQLFSDQQDFTARSAMDNYMQPAGTTYTVPEGASFAISTLRPGGTAAFQAEFTAAGAGFTQFGVYPLEAHVTDVFDTGLFAIAKTLLPYWTGAGSQVRPLRTAWVWPLIDSPHRQACPALTDNSLAASFGSGGRLAGLLAAGAQYPQADLTWAIDPALLGDAQTMGRPYHTGGSVTDCAGAAPHPASKAAGTWLDTLGSATAGQQVDLTPYANVDIAALDRHGMSADVASAYTLGKSKAQDVLHRTFGTSMALPAGGIADLSTLTALATREHVTGVVLDSTEMPYADQNNFAEDAVSQVRTGAGTTMNVLLADDTLTKVLAGASGATQAARFAVEQRYLAETAMIAAQSPTSQRSLVVDPPETWAPSQAAAGALLQETVSAPWLKPVTLASLAGSTDSETSQQRQQPPSSKVSPRELTKPYLHAVSEVGSVLAPYRSMLYQSTGYSEQLAEALAATESSGWRGGGRSAAAGAALTRDLSAYLTRAESKVKFLTAPSVRMGGSSGTLPFSVQNGLEETIRVEVTASTLKGSPLKIGGKPAPAELIIKPAQSGSVRVPVSSAPAQGTFSIMLGLTSHDGTPLPFATKTISVQSTRYGRAILILIAAAIGVLLATSAVRAGRRWLQDGGGAHGGGHGGGHGGQGNGHGGHGARANQTGPSNVVISERHPTEAPDDLADARRWADDT